MRSEPSGVLGAAAGDAFSLVHRAGIEGRNCKSVIAVWHAISAECVHCQARSPRILP